jgi:iron complex outermembrane receptor protein
MRDEKVGLTRAAEQNRRAERRQFLSILVATTTLATSAAVIARPARAQQATPTAATNEVTHFSIPGQPLAAAISAFIRRTGWQISYSSALARGQISTPINGDMTPAQALRRLVSDTAIQVLFNAPGSAALVSPMAAAANVGDDGAVPLDPIDIGAERAGKIDNWNAPPAYSGGQVATGAKLGALGNTSVMNAPFSVTGFTSKTIKDQQAITVADVVANDPSVRVYTTGLGSSAGQGDSLRIRGFGVGASSVFFDGLGGIAPLRLIPVETMERVEILKGPNALLNGFSGYAALGGMVNVVPKRATDAPIASVTASYFSNSLFGTHIDVGRRFGENNEWGVRVNGLFRGGNTAIDGQFAELGVGALALDYRGGDFRASIDVGHVNSTVDSPTGSAGFGVSPAVLTLPAPKASKQIYQNWEYAKSRSTYVVGKFEYDIDKNWMIYGAAGYRYSNEAYLSSDIYVTDKLGNASVSAYYTPFNRGSTSAQIGTRGEFSTGPVNHKASLNVASIFDTMNYTGEYYGFYNFYTNIYNTPRIARPSTAGLSNNPPKYWEQTFPTVTLADTLSFFDDRVLLTAGVRYQQINQTVFASDGTIPQPPYGDLAFTPAFGLVVKPLERLSLYANYIQGLEQGPTAWGGSNRGQIFPPVRTEQIETGVKYDFGAIAATASFFEITQPSAVITTDADGNSTFGVNGQQRNSGVELNLFGEVVPGIRLLGGFSYTQGTLTKTADGTYDGKAAIGVPKWQSNFGIEWDPGFVEGATLSGRMLTTSSQYLDQANTQKISGWTRFDFGVQYKLQAFAYPVVLRARVENAFDKSYWAGVDGGWVTMGLPRTFKLSATVDF